MVLSRYLLLFVSFALVSLNFPAPSRADTVGVEVVHSTDGYVPGRAYPILFRLNISSGWYIHGPGKGENLIPTEFAFEGPAGLGLSEIRFPEPQNRKFPYAPDPIEVYSGSMLVQAGLVLESNVPSGTYHLKGRLAYQACSFDSCLPPEETSFAIPVKVVTEAASTRPLNQELFVSVEDEGAFTPELPGGMWGMGLWLTLIGIFLGGLALNLTPCIYPLIPITVSYFGGRSRDLKGSAVLFHGGLYMAGLALTNSLLGLTAALSGGMLGSALQNPFVLVFVAAIMVWLSLNLFGFWEMRLPSGLTRLASKNYSGYFGTFFMGLTLGVVAAPCLGPFVLGLLTYVGQRGDALLGFLYFFVLSLGLGLPLALLAVFSGAIDRLPVSGDWMLWVRKLMGWIMVGMAVYILLPLVPYPWAESGLMALTAVAAGVHLGWIDKTGGGFRRFLLFKRILGALLIIAAISYLPLTLQKKEDIHWTPYSPEALSAAISAKRPVIIDFSAQWCTPCREMEDSVFLDPEVKRSIGPFSTIRVDLTNRQPYQEELLKRYRVKGVPTILFLNSEGVEEQGLRIESLVSKEEFLARLEQAASYQREEMNFSTE